MSKKGKIRCILVKVFEQPKVIEIEHNLSTLQNYVGGIIDSRNRGRCRYYYK